MKAAIITANKNDAKRVYDSGVIDKLKSRYELCNSIISKKNLNENIEFLRQTEYLFATWGMERFSKEEINKYFPNVKCIYYAAGSVQGFAKEFLESGIRVFSAWRANAVPVAEFTYAQIILATKGYFNAARTARFLFYPAAQYSNACGGNYAAKIGIIGVGGIGSMVAKKLKANEVEVLYYDPYLPKERAEALDIKEATLEHIFSECDVITNHLANKEELTGVLNWELFNKMKPYATFINTGRGRQVDEKGLVKAMKKVKTRTALLDVTTHEPLNPFGRIARCKNIIVTPHIAGSNGREVVRMAEYMLDEAKRVDEGEETLHEVSLQMLQTMA